MSDSPSYRSHVVPALAWIITLCGVGPMRAQQSLDRLVEYQPAVEVATPTVEGRIEAGVGDPVWLAPREQEKLTDPTEQGWDIGIQLEAAYNDNIFLNRVAPESDVIFRIVPKLEYENGVENEQGAYVHAIYRPAGVIYLDHGSENRIDHQVSVVAGVQGRRTGLVYKGGFQRMGEPTSELGGIRSDRTEYQNEVRLIWRPREKLGVQLAAGQTTQNYDEVTLTDSESTYIEAALEFTYSPKTTLVTAYRAGNYEVDRSPDQSFQQATVQMIWKPREKWSFSVKGGIESRDYGQGSDSYGVFDARAEWAARVGTSLYVSGYRREDVSAVFAGQNIEVMGVTAGIRQKISEHWVAALEGGYETADYKQVSGPGTANRGDEVVFVRPSLEYSVTDDFRVGVRYRYERNASSAANFGYDNHQIGVDLEYEF